MKTGQSISLVLFLTCLSAALPAAAYDAKQVSGGGSIEGIVTFNGPVVIKKIIPNKDAETCGGPRDEPTIRVSDNKGVQDAVVYLKDVAAGKAWGATPKKPAIDQKGCRFEPTVQVVRAGPLDIVNSDPVLHNTHGFYGQRTAFNVALPNKGDKVSKDVKRAGMVRVECDAHGWMLGWVYVADNPYYAVTAKDGAFSMKDVPPGDYTLVATQAHTGDTEVQVTVRSGQAAKVGVELIKKE